MASKKQVVELIAMQCSECKRRNYTTSKNRRVLGDKLALIAQLAEHIHGKDEVISSILIEG